MGHSKLVGAVSNCAVSTHHGTYAVRLQTAPTGERKCLFIFSVYYNSKIYHKWKDKQMLEVDKMFKSKHLFWGVIPLCVLFISSASGSAPRFLSGSQVNEAELIIIGIVSNQQLLSGKTETRKISDNSYSASFTFDGMVYHIKVEEVLLDNRQAKGNRSRKLLYVYAFVPYPFSNISPYCVSGQRCLVFLDPLNIDPTIVKRHPLLKMKNAYAFVSNTIAGSHQLSSDKETPSMSEYIKENLQYAEFTKVFCEVMSIPNLVQREQRLRELLNHDDALLAGNARAALRKIERDRKLKKRSVELEQKE